MSNLTTPEPDPQKNNYPAVWDLVIADMRARDEYGRSHYGTPLQPHNGRNALVDAYQEVLDLSAYLRQRIYEQTAKIAGVINDLAEEVHRRSVEAGWWSTPEQANIPTKLALIHSEVSEALEGFRKNLDDDHLPHRKMIAVELADAVIRIADLAGALKCDLGGAVIEKMEYNLRRADHKPENRVREGGKSF